MPNGALFANHGQTKTNGMSRILSALTMLTMAIAATACGGDDDKVIIGGGGSTPINTPGAL